MIYQVMPNLSAEEYAELKADIQLRGVMVPIEFDEKGNVLDGHHRLQICGELGITDYPVDLDFLFLEYDRGKATAIVEYKNEHARPQYASHPTYQAMIDVGNRAKLPVLACRYADDFSWWRVVPLNQEARKYVPHRVTITEQDWVRLLYKIRGYDVPQEVLDGISVEV